jgi:hypothetical protein
MADSTPRSRASERAGRSRRAGSSRSRSAAARRAAATRARARSGGTRRATAARSSARRASASRASSNGSSGRNGQLGPLESVGDTVSSATRKVSGPLLAGGAAAAGAIGGIVLGTRVLRPRPRRVLGIPVPRDGIGLKPLAKEVRKASKQIERMADEVGKAREQAQKVGKALS